MNLSITNSFTLLQPNWVHLAPYGDFPHPRGLQRVDRTSAEIMVRNFNSFLGKLGRLFGGLPFYIGHPDLPGASDAADKKAYGWITRLEARDDGLHGQVKWSEPGLELLRNGHFKFFSPYWEAEELAHTGTGKIYRPIRLLSVGLTNQPNLPVNPLANEESRPGALNRCTLVSPSQPPDRASSICSILDAALARGTISPAEEHLWRTRLENDPSAALSTLAQQPPALHVTSETDQLRFQRRRTIGIPNRRHHLAEMVRHRLNLGLTYDQAWEDLRRDYPHLFEPNT